MLLSVWLRTEWSNLIMEEGRRWNSNSFSTEAEKNQYKGGVQHQFWRDSLFMGYVTVWEGKWESLESEKCVWKGSLKHFWPICIVKHPPLPPPPFTHESGMMAELLERRTLVAYQLMPRGPTSAKDKYGVYCNLLDLTFIRGGCCL